LRWEDVDLKTGLLRVRQSVTRGHVTEPKSGKGRDVPLSDDTVAAFKTPRHLRGPLVFCDQDGKMLVKTECKWPLWRACQRAGLRHISWHVLRHSFASHLAMCGVLLKVVQDLFGRATMDMTMRYAHLSPNIPREAVKALDREAVAPTWHRRSNLSDNAGQVAAIIRKESGGAGSRTPPDDAGFDPSRSVSGGFLVDDATADRPSMPVSIDHDPSSGRTVENGAAAVDQQLALALTQWKHAHDVRALRRELLQLLACLED
jgi:hypothetical protein